MNSLRSFLYVDFGGTCLVQFLLERITTDRNGWTSVLASRPPNQRVDLQIGG